MLPPLRHLLKCRGAPPSNPQNPGTIPQHTCSLQLGQRGDQVLLRHQAEHGALHGGALGGEDAALARDVTLNPKS